MKGELLHVLDCVNGEKHCDHQHAQLGLGEINVVSIVRGTPVDEERK